MATQELLQVYGDQLLFADATDFPNSGAGPPTTAANSIIIGTPTKVQIDLTGVSAAAARQSDKTASLAKTGSAWPIQWVFGACMENETAPTAGGTFDFYWAASPNSTAGTGNPGATTGVDGTFTVGTENQLIRIGSLVVANTVINIKTAVGTIWLPHLYGSLVVINNTSTALRSTATAMDETHIVATPVIPDAQAAA
jgi:hypothetical protein